MSRLSDLYQAMETLRKEGLSLNKDLEYQVAKLEEDIIKNDILPFITENIAPALQQVQRELILVVDYIPGSPISVHLSRKRNFTQLLTDVKEVVMDKDVKEVAIDKDVKERDKKEIETEVKEEIIDPEVTHTSRCTGSSYITRGTTKALSVTFPDGTIIAEKKATDTLMAVVKKIGVDKVRKAVEEHNLIFCRVPVISNRLDRKYGKTQKDLGNGWLLMTHSNNPMKKNFIEKLSDIYNLNLIVELDE